MAEIDNDISDSFIQGPMDSGLRRSDGVVISYAIALLGHCVVAFHLGGLIIVIRLAHLDRSIGYNAKAQRHRDAKYGFVTA